MNQPSLGGFDWNALDPDTRFIVKQTTERLHDLERKTGEAIIQIGRGLSDTKERLGHGQFEQWLSAEFGWSRSTAYKFVQVADAFGDRVQNLDIAPSALYALASGNVPESLRDEFVAKAEAGEPVRHKDVKHRLATVDLDSGELVEDNDAPIPPKHQTHSLSFVPSHRAQAFSDGLIEAVAPSSIAKALADCEFRLLGARRAWREFPADVVVQYADSSDAQQTINAIIRESQELLSAASDVSRQLAAGQKLRAVK